MASKGRVLPPAGQKGSLQSGMKADRSKKGILQFAQRLSLGRVTRFLREVRAEMKKVVWPSRKELGVYTMVVIVTVVAVAGFIGLIDLVFSQFLRLVM